MKVAEIIQDLRRRLAELLPVEKIRWHAPGRSGPDPVVEAWVRGRKLILVIEIKSQLNHASMRSSIEQARRHASGIRGAVPIVVAPYLGEGLRKLSREMECAYLDLSGNVWLESGPVLIDRDGRPNLYPQEPRRRNVFADKANIILRFLLERPAESYGIRALAREVDLSPGYVSKMVRVAAEQGHAAIDSKGRVRIRSIPELLSDWCSFYHWKRNGCDAYFCSPRRLPELRRVLKVKSKRASQDADYAVSLHQGNNLVDPVVDYDIWHLYEARPGFADRLRRHLRLEPVPRDAGNIAVLQPYYRESFSFGSRIVKGIRVVSDLQLYLDLRRYPVRGEEAAEAIYRKRLAPEWGLQNAGR